MANLTGRTQVSAEQLASQLFSTGVSETQAADQIYAQLMQVQMQQDANLSNSIGNLVSSFARLGTPIAPGASAGG